MRSDMMFCKSRSLQAYQLPPTKVALKQHIKRGNYLAYLLMNSLQRSFEDQKIQMSKDGN